MVFSLQIAQFKKDEQIMKEALCVHVTSVTSQDFYDLLHFSPLKVIVFRFQNVSFLGIGKCSYLHS